MSREITGNVRELENLNIEIKRLSKQLRKLRARKKKLEGEISQYLEATNKPGVKYKGTAIIAENKIKYVKNRKKVDKENDGTYVLSQYGVKNPEKVLKELLEAMKGPKENTTVLKIKKFQK